MTIQKKEGSALAFSLLYIALLLILVIGISTLMTRIFRVNGYITQSVQAGYNSESAFELALYDLKMHREGYENTQIFEGDKIGYSSQNSVGYKIEYRNTQNEGKITIPLSNKKRQFALFFEDKAVINDLKNFSLNYWTEGSLESLFEPLTKSDECMELRLTGKNGSEFETVTAHVACPQTSTPLGEVRFFQRKADAPTIQTEISLKDFISTHKENYMVANLIPPLKDKDKESDMKLYLLSNQTIASFDKVVTTIGRFNNLEIKRKVTFPQDQTPDLLSIAIYQK